MHAALDWLLGLGGGLSTREGGLELQAALPAWAWVAVVAAAAGLGVLAYRRVPGAAAPRALAAALRALALLAVVVLLCGPSWIQRREKVEPDRVVLLIDRSASLLTEDAEAPASLGLGDRADPASEARRSRDAALRERLAADGPAIAALEGPRRRVRWLGFGGGVFPLQGGSGGGGVPDPGPAEREATGVLAAVLEAAADPSGAPVAAVILMSDGRSREAIGPAAEARLAEAGVPVFAVPLGPGGAAPDASVGPVAAPPRAFRGDRVPVSVEVQGLASVPPGAGVVVRLLEPAPGGADAAPAVLDERRVDAASLAAAGGRVRLRGRAAEPGRRAWEVRVEPLDGERNTANNHRPVAVEVLDRPLRVLYAEGPPRWEYRYLKNLLLREASVEVSVLLFSADAGFAPEGDARIGRFPVDAAELAAYDVVVVGDVEPGYLSEAQERLIVDRVSDGGAGVLFIGGPRRMPAAWAGRPLAALLPLADPGAVTRAPGEAFGVRTGPLAESLAVLDLVGDDAADREGLPAREAAVRGVLPLPELRYAQRLGPLKPLAETLASWQRVGDGSGSGDAPASGPLVVRMRAGAGQVLYTGTDDAWAWRRGVGERYPERYFLQMIRLLGRGVAGTGDGPAELAVADRRLVRGGTTAVELTLRAGGGGDRLAGDEVAVAVRRLDPGDPAGAEGVPVGELTLRADRGNGGAGPGPGFSEEAGGPAGGLRRLRALWSPERAGRYRLVPTDPTLAALGVAAAAEVVADADERRDTATDHPKLAAIAAATGGRVVPLTGLGSFVSDAGSLPGVARVTPDDQAASLRHAPLALLAVLLPLFGEWLIRRRLRLA
ncbi:hypothetical protein [Phycisphaera mikurensis]|uniref:VWFA domain-containing protein n=1 Tax=Phycisphaera mikurensis (strain NBRC 102666 / KCTC 22515 / FYK2301M01) TaxID=1142394 RepID=I0IBQ6_PHYMF|nr:hypothetical protein [Phycisphaera mikurensis]MBB6443390.1 hypothetical protein [Phycisphaera mikurensis]BAM02694.1 hypothetical protein PSMK_05350 [Phycisphaera mikurensis NBRC 102666]